MNRTRMPVSAHADDVELHFGGTLFKYHDRDYNVASIMATNNISGSVRVPSADGTVTKDAT